MKIQVHFGKRFYLHTYKKIWYRPENGKMLQAHRWVWSNHHGEIPEGYHIHHKNTDKNDNSIENLEMLSPTDHLKLHHSTDEWKKKNKEWNQKFRLVNSWDHRPYFDKKCTGCGTSFKTRASGMNR